jgi:hypothetical protein
LAYRVRAVFIYEWLADGAGSALTGQMQADQPGYGAAGVPGAIGVAQTYSDIVGEVVPGGDSPSGANFQTAINLLATDEYTRFITAGSAPGFTNGTPLALVQAWSTGNP